MGTVGTEVRGGAMMGMSGTVAVSREGVVEGAHDGRCATQSGTRGNPCCDTRAPPSLLRA